MANTVVINVQANTAAATADLTTTTVAVDNLTKAEKRLNKETGQTASQFEEVTKNGGAIAILDQLTGGLASRVRDTFEATKLFNFSLKSMRTALIATGIGAFVVLLGTVVSYWDEITDFITGATRDLEKQRAEYERINKQLETEVSLLTQQKELLELQGKPTREITNELRKQLLLQQEINIESLKSYENQLEQQKEQNKELTWWESVKAAVVFRFNKEKGLKLLGESISENSEETAETEAKIKEIKDKNFEISKKLLALDKEAIEVVKKRSEFLEEIRLGMINTEEEKRAEELNQLDIFYDDLIQKAIDYYGVLSPIVLELEESLAQKKKDINVKYAKEEEEIKQKSLDDDITITEARKILQLQLVEASGSAIGALGSLFQEGTAASKAAALAEIIIGTGVGYVQGLDIAQKSAKGTGPAAAFAFPIFYAQQIAAVAGAAKQASNILKTVKGGGGGSAPVSAPTSTPVQVPAFNIVGQGEGSQIASALGEQQQTPIQAFVVAQDVTTAQSLENGIIQGATLGD